ncbi:MAG: TolC family protein [Vicinamibacteraceae bacterium]
MRLLAIVAAAAVSLLPAAAAAQTLTLQDAIASALAKNREIVVERESVVQSREGIARAEAAFDPVVRGETRYRDQTFPVISILSGAQPGDLAPTTRGLSSAASFSRLFGSGASVTASTSLSRDTSNSFLTLISPAWFTSLGVELRQPLLQGRAIDPARRAVRVSRAAVDRSEASLRRVVAETVAAVEQAYWNVIAARRDVSIRESTLALADRQRADATIRVEAQVVPESDLAQFTAEIERRRGDLFAARELAIRAELLLKALILDSADAPQWNTTLALEDPPPPTPAPVDVDAALKAAAERPELADLDARKALQAIELDAARDRLKPQLDLVGGYTARGVAGARSDGVRPIPGLSVEFADELQGALGASLESVALHRFPDVTAGLALTIPLGYRAARADIAAAESATRQIVAARAHPHPDCRRGPQRRRRARHRRPAHRGGPRRPGSRGDPAAGRRRSPDGWRHDAVLRADAAERPDRRRSRRRGRGRSLPAGPDRVRPRPRHAVA